MDCNYSRCEENKGDGKCGAPKDTKFNAPWCPKSDLTMPIQTQHEISYDNAVKALERLFGDMSVSQTEIKKSLQALRDEIDIKLECLSNTDKETKSNEM